MRDHAPKARPDLQKEPAPSREIEGPQDGSLMQMAAMMNASPKVAGLQARSDTLQRAAVVQRMPVGSGDVGSDFIIWYDGAERVATLLGYAGGGWYNFRIERREVNIRGHANILRHASAGPMDVEGDSEEDASEDDGPSTSGGGYSALHVAADRSEFNIVAVAKANGISVQEALMRIRNGFRVVPRTLRLHFPFGSKTVARGTPAFRTPDETEKEPQAMVSYRKGDYGKHKKVGKDYDEWADELSGDEEDESVKRARAKKMVGFLEGDEEEDFSKLNSRQKAAMGGLFSVGLISDPLRTEYNSARTEGDFMAGLRARAQGDTSFHELFGSKTDSTFLPARSGGSSAQREHLLEQTRKEVRGTAALWQNNCLINAICRAAHGRNANLMELMTIRFELGSIGNMMLATPGSINVIRHVLRINNEIIIRYPGIVPDETFAGVPAALNVYHTGGNHFQANRPRGGGYTK